MNKQSKDGNISWTDYTWNPIKGLCPVGCWYCYARAMYKRFKWNPTIYWDGRVPILSNKKPSKIFVCSMIELFHPRVSHPKAGKEWRDRIFKVIENNPQHTFQILTKMPENIDRPMPDNVWLGVSITTQGEFKRYKLLEEATASVKFISFEPLLSYIGLSFDFNVDWIIIGKLTGYAKWRNPDEYWIYVITEEAKDRGIPIFLKNNLKDIWGKKLIQEFPK